MTLVVGVMSVAAFSRGAPTQVGAVQGTRAKFDEIDVERINVRRAERQLSAGDLESAAVDRSDLQEQAVRLRGRRPARA